MSLPSIVCWFQVPCWSRAMASGQNQTRLHAKRIRDIHHPSFSSIVCWCSGAVLVTPDGMWPAPDQIACQTHLRQSSSILPKHSVLVPGAVLVMPDGKWPEPDQIACQQHPRQSLCVLPKHCWFQVLCRSRPMASGQNQTRLHAKSI